MRHEEQARKTTGNMERVVVLQQRSDARGIFHPSNGAFCLAVEAQLLYMSRTLACLRHELDRAAATAELSIKQAHCTAKVSDAEGAPAGKAQSRSEPVTAGRDL